MWWIVAWLAQVTARTRCPFNTSLHLMDSIPPNIQAAEHWSTSEPSSSARLGNLPTFCNRGFFPPDLFVFACTKTQCFRVCPTKLLAALGGHSALPKRPQSPPVLQYPMDKPGARTSPLKWPCIPQAVAASCWLSRSAQPSVQSHLLQTLLPAHTQGSVHRNSMCRCNPVWQVVLVTQTQISLKSTQTTAPELLVTISSVAHTEPTSWVVYGQGGGYLHKLNVLD